MSFELLNLHPQLTRAIEACNFSEPTAIQQQAIPVVMEGRDLMASAQTGTGKTAAFVLPALQRLLDKPNMAGTGPRVLVLTPTRELAMQVSDNVQQLSRFGKFVSGNVVGGMAYPPQIKLLRRSVDILVATPGRLMDHMDAGRIDFSRLEILILDEADRMLDMGFVDDIRKIAAATPTNRQTLLFSATLEGKVLTVAKQLLKNPERIQLAANQDRHESIDQLAHQADDFSHKNRLLGHYINNDDMTQAVIFTATKRGADKLAKSLATQGHTSAALHGDMGQGARKRTVEQMRRGKFKLLVATDVAARGLDIKGITHVINFDMPMVAEDYVHRIGRTGRAGAKGTAISLIGPEDWSKLSGIERLTGQKLKRDIITGMEPRKPEPRKSHAPSNGRKKPGGYRGHKSANSGATRTQGKSSQRRGGNRQPASGQRSST